MAPLDDPRIPAFVAGLDPVNAAAESAPEFIWRLKSDSGNATDVEFDGDPLTIVNMSVWTSPEALRDFMYAAPHAAFLRDRRRWFEKMDAPHTCLWWVPAGHRPTAAEGRERLLHFWEYGATERAFSSSRLFPAPDA